MKRTLLLIMSIVLVLACVFSLIRIVPAVGDLRNIYEYKMADSDFAKEGIAQARDAIALLGENEQLYVDNVGTYVSGKAQLAAAGQQLADGKRQYAAGVQQLAEGDALLSTFEDGEGQLSAGLYQLLQSMSPSYHQKSFTQTVDSLPEYLAKTEEMKTDIPALYNGDGFDEAAYTELCDAIFDKLFQKDENGDYICTERDGKSLQLLNLDNCSLLLDKAEQYMADSEVDVTAEVVARVVCYALIAIAAIFGIVAGIMGIVSAVSGKGKCGKGFGCTAAVLSIGAFVYAIISKFGDYIYGVRLDAAGAYSTAMEGTHIEYSGETQHPVFIIMLVAAVLFAVAAIIANKSMNKPESTVMAEAVSAAAGVEKSQRVIQLEAENAELKAMVAEMAAEAATVKE